MDAFTARM
jgi:hypothetical protein